MTTESLPSDSEETSDDQEHEVWTVCEELGHPDREDEDRPGRHVCETCQDEYQD